MDEKIKDIANRINIVNQKLKKITTNSASYEDKIFLKKILITLEKVLEYIKK